MTTPQPDYARQADYARVRELVARIDPLLIEARADVDCELLRWGLSLSPWERLRACSETMHFWAEFRRVASEAS